MSFLFTNDEHYGVCDDAYCGVKTCKSFRYSRSVSDME